MSMTRQHCVCHNGYMIITHKSLVMIDKMVKLDKTYFKHECERNLSYANA